jgi:hypothetical protein
VDNRHQCLHEPDRSNIIRMFGGMPNFFGCLICGQYHICHADYKECVIITDPLQQRLSCHYSGLIVNGEVEFVSNQGGGCGDDVPLDEESVNTKKSFGVYMNKKTDYTNIHIHMPKKVRPLVNAATTTPTPIVPIQQTNTKDMRHKESVESDSSDDDHPHLLEVEEEVVEGMDDMIDSVSYFNDKKRTVHSNHDYWNDYYSFLSREDVTGVGGGTTNPTPTQPQPIIEEKECAPHFITNLLTAEMEQEIIVAVSLVIERLISLQLSKGGNEVSAATATTKYILPQLTQYFLHMVRNIVLLVYNAPNTTMTHTPTQLAEATMLGLFIESRDGYDSLGYRFCLWSKNPWLSQLHHDGTMGQLFLEKKRKTKKRKKGQPPYDKDKVTMVVTDIKYCLGLYAEYDLWLKQFILTNK